MSFPRISYSPPQWVEPVTPEEMYASSLKAFTDWLSDPDRRWPKVKHYLVHDTSLMSVSLGLSYELPKFRTVHLPDVPDELLLRAASFYLYPEVAYQKWLSRFDRFPLGDQQEILRQSLENRNRQELRHRVSRRISAGLEGYQEKGQPEEWDTAMGTVKGFRTWTVLNNMNLRGHYNTEWHSVGSSPWIPGVLRGEDGLYEAKCYVHRDHKVPTESCGCGFWAYWDDIGLDSPMGGVPQVIGCVEGSGRIIIGERGFRAQYIRIKALYANDHAYGPAVHRLNDYGAPVTSSMGNQVSLKQWMKDMGEDPHYASPGFRYPELVKYSAEELKSYRYLIQEINRSDLSGYFFEELKLADKILSAKGVTDGGSPAGRDSQGPREDSA